MQASPSGMAAVLQTGYVGSVAESHRRYYRRATGDKTIYAGVA